MKIAALTPDAGPAPQRWVGFSPGGHLILGGKLDSKHLQNDTNDGEGWFFHDNDDGVFFYQATVKNTVKQKHKVYVRCPQKHGYLMVSTV